MQEGKYCKSKDDQIHHQNTHLRHDLQKTAHLCTQQRLQHRKATERRMPKLLRDPMRHRKRYTKNEIPTGSIMAHTSIQISIDRLSHTLFKSTRIQQDH